MRNYTSMSGRASRSEYWWWALVQGLVLVILCFLAAPAFDETSPSSTATLIASAGLFFFVFGTFVPNITVMVRRLHDTGRSGFWYFITFVPVIGGIWFLILMVLGSEQNANRFGGPPTSDGSKPSGPVRTRAPSNDIYDREDVSNAYVAAYTTDPRVAAMRKAAAENADMDMDFEAQRKSEISDYYKNKVLGGDKPAGPPPH